MDGHHSKQFLECVLEALTVARLEIMNSCHNYVCLFLTVDLEVDDGGEGVVDAVLRLAEVPPLVALLHLRAKAEKETNETEESICGQLRVGEAGL